MYCHACGIALTQPTKYCNRCGAQLVVANPERKEKTETEKRTDEYLDGLFWVTVFGLGFIIGGVILLKKFGFSDLVQLVYAAISASLFLINFGLNFWRATRLMRSSKEEERLTMQPVPETAQLNPVRPEMFITAANSVTENTTRSFEPIPGVNRSGSE
jgi:hypothetical protein